MSPSRAVFIIAVDFMGDFLSTFATGLGVGVAGSSDTSSSPVPSRWMVYIAVLGGLVTAFRGIKRNLTNLVVSEKPGVKPGVPQPISPTSSPFL